MMTVSNYWKPGGSEPTFQLICYVENNYGDDITAVTITFFKDGGTVQIAEQNVGSVPPGNQPYDLGPYPQGEDVTCVVDWTDPLGNPTTDDPAAHIGDYNFQLSVGP